MLAEKFILLLETLLNGQTHSDGSPRVVSTSPHIPVKLPRGSQGNAQGNAPREACWQQARSPQRARILHRPRDGADSLLRYA